MGSRKADVAREHNGNTMSHTWVSVVLAFSAFAADDARDVVVATRRAGRVEIFDAGTLQPLGTIGVEPLAESIQPSPDGRTLFIAQAMRSIPNSCCGLFALNLETREMCFLREPAMRSTPSPDGRKLFFQRGNVGIEVQDARTFKRLSTIQAPGVYALKPSPDGRWLLGITNWKSPAVDIFDLTTNAMTRHIEIPQLSSSGGWVGDRFLLYGFDGHEGSLWTLTPSSTSLGEAVKVGAFPALPQNCQPYGANLAVSGGHSFLYELFGGKGDSGDNCGGRIPGGVFEIDASTGAMLTHLLPGMNFGRLAVSGDGEHLYGIVISQGWTGVRLVDVERKSGEVIAERSLEDDVWNIALARIPSSLVPSGYSTPAACSKTLP